MSNWIIAPGITAPQPPPATANIAEFMVAFGIYDDLKTPTNFTSGQMGPQYASPQAYLANKVAQAQSLQADTLIQPPLADTSWDAKGAATKLCGAAFVALQSIAVNASDPDSWSVFLAWVMGTGSLYGGHPATPVPSGSTGLNPSTGPSAVPDSPILGGEA